MNEGWNVDSCVQEFSSVEVATEFFCAKKYDGHILKRENGVYTGVCLEYPDGFYPDAKIIKTLNCSSSSKNTSCC
tara:strand:+ start:228 stop:452 length:225 start_codon:yes stop_codon:yes gene_type:complete